ncbi:MAG: hypothetical protein M3Q55_02735 [Acidobacteriota bacterium]|nr:hypothetical protein [Acidobacteriota bacterium]
MKTAALLAGVLAAATTLTAQQAPRPFPGAPARPASQTPASQPADQTTQAAVPAVDPTVGVPLYPGAVLIGTFDANPAQPFYLYGTTSAYTTVVEYYRQVLKDRGRQLFGGPMHQFDLGRFRRETMALQPALTVKDYTWNGRDGYVHVDGREVTKFPTVIQVVPVTMP